MPYLILLSLLLPLNALAGCKPGAPEAFARFIDAFARDKTFALARTLYPMPILRHEIGYEDGKVIDETVATPLSREDDAALPTMRSYARDNGLQLSTSSVRKGSGSAGSATVRIEKPDTDWLLTYHFVRRAGCWYLQRIEDHSV